MSTLFLGTTVFLVSLLLKCVISLKDQSLFEFFVPKLVCVCVIESCVHSRFVWSVNIIITCCSHDHRRSRVRKERMESLFICRSDVKNVSSCSSNNDITTQENHLQNTIMTATTPSSLTNKRVWSVRVRSRNTLFLKLCF